MTRYDVFAFALGYAACLILGLFIPGPPSLELLLTVVANMWGIIICTCLDCYRRWREIAETPT